MTNKSDGLSVLGKLNVVANLVVHYKDRMYTLQDVYLHKYDPDTLVRDVREEARKSGGPFPENVSFIWHPPGKENQRWPLGGIVDWVTLVLLWKDVRQRCIPLYICDSTDTDVQRDASRDNRAMSVKVEKGVKIHEAGGQLKGVKKRVKKEVKKVKKEVRRPFTRSQGRSLADAICFIDEDETDVREEGRSQEVNLSAAEEWVDTLIVTPPQPQTRPPKMIPRRPVTRSHVVSTLAKPTGSVEVGVQSASSPRKSPRLKAHSSPKSSPQSGKEGSKSKSKSKDIGCGPPSPTACQQMLPTQCSQTHKDSPVINPAEENASPKPTSESNPHIISNRSKTLFYTLPPSSSKPPKVPHSTTKPSPSKSKPSTSKRSTATGAKKPSSSQPDWEDIDVCLSDIGISDWGDLDVSSLLKPRAECEDKRDWELEPDEVANEGALFVLPEENAVSEEDSSEDDDFEAGDQVSEDDDETSLEEETFSTDEDDDEVDLEAQRQRRQRLSAEIIDEEQDSNLLVNKFARAYSKGTVWIRDRDKKVSLKPGHIFSSKEELLDVFREYCLQEGFAVKKVKHEKTRYTVECKDDSCFWRFHASQYACRNTWIVRSIKRGHCCERLEHNPMATSTWVAKYLLPYFVAAPKMDVDGMQVILMKKFGVHVEKYTLWRARKLMRAEVEGRHDEGYKYLPAYSEEFKEKNPGSVTFITWTEPELQDIPRNPIFKRMLICVGPAIEGFLQFCRPLIGIDACHLKGVYKGVLLTAMALDPNNGQFPLGYAVVEKENYEEWKFFLNGIVRALGAVENQSKFTFISDRHKGIHKALDEVTPTANRRVCIVHYYKNFACNFPGSWYHAHFYIAANAYAPYVHQKAMDKIKQKDPAAYHWLRESVPLEQWARFKFDQSTKCDDNTNNFVESFNNAINRFRGLPILTLLEEIRKLIGSRFVRRFERAQQWEGKLVPYVKQKLCEAELEGRDLAGCLHAGAGKFDVKDNRKNFVVQLNQRDCVCGKWQLTGIPCKHAARCIARMKRNPEDYVDHCYNVETYRNLYNRIVHPISDPIMWNPRPNLPELDPPRHQVKKGRPQEHKRRESQFAPEPDLAQSQQVSTTIFGSGTTICKKCKEVGHNKATCGRPRDQYGRLLEKTNRKIKEGPKRPVGRPKKQHSAPSSAPSTAPPASSVLSYHRPQTRATTSQQPSHAPPASSVHSYHRPQTRATTSQQPSHAPPQKKRKVSK